MNLRRLGLSPRQTPGVLGISHQAHLVDQGRGTPAYREAKRRRIKELQEEPET